HTRSTRDWSSDVCSSDLLGDSVLPGLRLIRRLLDLHDDLLAGGTGRKVNGVGALLLVVLSCTGIVVWWPGIKTWRQSLTVHRNRSEERRVGRGRSYDWCG